MVFFKLISYLLHPLLFSFIGTFLYLYLSPEHILKQQEYIILLIVFVSTYIIPILLLSLLKKVQLINDFHLNTIDERKFPILFFIILSFLIGRTLNHIQIVDLLAEEGAVEEYLGMLAGGSSHPPLELLKSA